MIAKTYRYSFWQTHIASARCRREDKTIPEDERMKESHRRIALLCCLASLPISAAWADSLVATYTFNNTLAAVQPGVAALTAVDPLGTSSYQTANVFGTDQTTYHFDGAASPPADQGGLDFDTTGLLSGTNNYSVEMVVELDGNTGWRRLMDSLDRGSDLGLYIDPENHLDSFNDGGGGSLFTANSFFDIFVTIDSSNTVSGYFGGVQEFSETSASLDIATNTLGFFLDNVVGGGQGEWSSGDIALLRVFDTALTPDEVATETAYPSAGTVPEPGTWMLMLFGGAAGVAAFKRRGLSRQ
jgi:Concanavalin A-like lectin/glucanases superfamily/PEP-CTERM motif